MVVCNSVHQQTSTQSKVRADPCLGASRKRFWRDHRSHGTTRIYGSDWTHRTSGGWNNGANRPYRPYGTGWWWSNWTLWPNRYARANRSYRSRWWWSDGCSRSDGSTGADRNFRTDRSSRAYGICEQHYRTYRTPWSYWVSGRHWSYGAFRTDRTTRGNRRCRSYRTHRSFRSFESFWGRYRAGRLKRCCENFGPFSDLVYSTTAAVGCIGHRAHRAKHFSGEYFDTDSRR